MHEEVDRRKALGSIACGTGRFLALRRVSHVPNLPREGLTIRSTESHSPPPNNPEFDQRYWPRPQPQKHQHQNGESLIKQTYSTTMIEDGKEKKWHVVAYANKVSLSSFRDSDRF